MGLLDGKVAFITGAARGQGRSHALTLAREGADIIAIDLCKQIDAVDYPLATPEDLAETVRGVESLDRRIVASEADVRDKVALQAAFDTGIAQLGRVDIVLANAGVAPLGVDLEYNEAAYQAAIDVNLNGVFHTVEVARRRLVDQGNGGSIVLTSSTAGNSGVNVWGGASGEIGYTASKHGVVGLMRFYANLLAPNNIRVNAIHPTGVNTPMAVNEVFDAIFAAAPGGGAHLSNALPVELIEPEDLSNAILFLVSEAGRYITGVSLPVDAGFSNKK